MYRPRDWPLGVCILPDPQACLRQVNRFKPDTSTLPRWSLKNLRLGLCVLATFPPRKCGQAQRLKQNKYVRVFLVLSKGCLFRFGPRVIPYKWFPVYHSQRWYQPKGPAVLLTAERTRKRHSFTALVISISTSSGWTGESIDLQLRMPPWEARFVLDTNLGASTP